MSKQIEKGLSTYPQRQGVMLLLSCVTAEDTGYAGKAGDAGNTRCPRNKFFLVPPQLTEDSRKQEAVVSNESIQSDGSNGSDSLSGIDSHNDDLLGNLLDDLPFQNLADFSFGMWGGAVDEGETLPEALIRELTEEIDAILAKIPVSQIPFAKRVTIVEVIDTLFTDLSKVPVDTFRRLNDFLVVQRMLSETAVTGYEPRGVFAVAFYELCIEISSNLYEALISVGFRPVMPLADFEVPTIDEELLIVSLQKVRPYGQTLLRRLAKEAGGVVTHSQPAAAVETEEVLQVQKPAEEAKLQQDSVADQHLPNPAVSPSFLSVASTQNRDSHQDQPAAN